MTSRPLITAFLFTLLPRGGYAASGGLTFTLALDTSGTSFALTATYDSKAESGSQAKIAVTDLGSLAVQVAFLVTAGAPPAGALPADRRHGSVDRRPPRRTRRQHAAPHVLIRS